MQNLQYLMGVLLFIPSPERILILGVGGGSIIHFLRHYLPSAKITGIEYNAELLTIAQNQMGLPTPDETLEYVIDDARDFINQCQDQFDLIVVDIFDGGISPDWVTQQPSAENLKTCLSQQGAVAYNLLLTTEDEFTHFYQSLRETFQQQTLCMDTEEYENILVYATNFEAQPKSIEEFISLAQVNTEKYDIPFSQILSRIFDINPQGCGMI
jgi:spermidine synthase